MLILPTTPIKMVLGMSAPGLEFGGPMDYILRLKMVDSTALDVRTDVCSKSIAALRRSGGEE